MSKEESKSDVVETVRQLLSKITPDWRMEQSHDSDICKIVVGHGRWRDFDHHLEDNARLIIRAPVFLSSLCDEVEQLRSLNQTQSESIETFQSQFRVMKEAIEAALPFIDAMQRCHHNCTPESCSAEGQRRAKQGRVIAARLRKSITPKGSEQ